VVYLSVKDVIPAPLAEEKDATKHLEYTKGRGRYSYCCRFKPRDENSLDGDCQAAPRAKRRRALAELLLLLMLAGHELLSSLGNSLVVNLLHCNGQIE
jgi:hypothetical protein